MSSTKFKQNLDVTGDISLSGNIVIGGDTLSGDETNDSVTFNAEITSNIVPDADVTYDMGTVTKTWREVFTRKVNSAAGVDLDIHSGSDIALYPAGNIWIKQNTKLIFEGTVPDDFEAKLQATSVTADRDIILPDASGTIALIDATGGQVFINGTQTFRTSSTFSYPSYTAPLAIDNDTGDTVAFSMNVVGNDLDFVNNNGTLYLRSNNTEVLSIDGSGTVTATAFVGDGSGLTGTYGDADVDTHLNQSTATTGQVLSWNGTDYSWITGLAGSYTDADVDVHLNTSTATSGQYLTWNGTDYSWTTNINYTDADVDTHLNQSTATTGQVLSWNGTDYSWITGVSGTYTDADVDLHLNQSTATTGQVLSWNGTDYAWVAQSGGTTYDQSLNTTDDVTFNSVTTTDVTGTPEIESTGGILLTAATRVEVTQSPFKLASFTTAERDALIAENGDMIYNTTTNKFQGYANSTWVDLH